MHGITRFNANGQTFDIPETEAPNFLKDAPNAQRTRRFTAGGNTFDIPDGEADAFLKDAPDAVETRTVGYLGKDGKMLTVDVPLSDMPKFMRTTYLEDPEYAEDRKRAERNRTALRGIEEAEKADKSPLWEGTKEFFRQGYRGLTGDPTFFEEGYGKDSYMADFMKSINAFGNKVTNAFLGLGNDVEALGALALGNGNTGVKALDATANFLKEQAAGGRAYLERTFPSSIEQAVGRSDWATKAADKTGDLAAMMIEFAPGVGVAKNTARAGAEMTKLGAKAVPNAWTAAEKTAEAYTANVILKGATETYNAVYDDGVLNGLDPSRANYYACGAFAFKAMTDLWLFGKLKGDAAQVQRDIKGLGDAAKSFTKDATKTGTAMGAQGAALERIKQSVRHEGVKTPYDDLATAEAFGRGFAEGALVHTANAVGMRASAYLAPSSRAEIAERRQEYIDGWKFNLDNIRQELMNPEAGGFVGEVFRPQMTAICESVQNGTLPGRKAFMSCGIPGELCKTEAQRREIAQNFIDTIGITADARNARAAQNIIDVANMMSDADPIASNAYREWRDVITANSVPKDVRLWNGKKIVAERVDMGDGKSGYDIYHDAGDGTRQLITTSDEPLLLDAYADAKADMMNYFGIEAPKKPGLTAEPKKLREQIEETVKPTELAQETKNEEPTADRPQTVNEPVSGEPAPAETGKRDEGVAAGDGADTASPRGTAEAVAAPETSAPSAEATLERGAQDALAAALEAVKPTAKKRPGKVAAKTETPNDWRTMKVDEGDADGKPLDETMKMALRQMKVLGDMHDTWRDTSRKNFDAYVKLFDEIEAARDFGKDSAGLSGSIDARKVARDLALSKFATPEEVARFKKYYEGEQTAEEPIAQEPSKTPIKLSAAEPAQAAEPTAPSASEKPQGLNLNAESIRRANDVSMMGTAGDTLAKEARSVYESGLKKLADTDGMTPEEKAQAATEREQWKALVESAYNDMIAKRANWVSPAVAGPAKYNTRKWGKRQDAMIAAGNEWQGKMERFIENAGKRIREAAPEQVQIDRIRANGTDEAINGGDANAAEKIQAKIDNLRAEQERMKAMNAWFRKHKTMVGFEGLSDETAKKMDEKIANGFSWEKVPAPGWALKNNGANIRRLEQRLDEVKANAAKAAAATPTESAWGTVTENAEANRLQVAFSGGKPSEDVTALMRHNGFKWSPKNGVWQRQLTNNARRTMERIKSELDKLFSVDADKAAKAEAFNAPAFEVGANGEKVAIGPKAETSKNEQWEIQYNKNGLKRTEYFTSREDAEKALVGKRDGRLRDVTNRKYDFDRKGKKEKVVGESGVIEYTLSDEGKWISPDEYKKYAESKYGDASSEQPAAEPASAAPKRRPGKKTETATAPVDAQYDRAVKAVESAEKESANARSFDELADINSRARSALGKITREQENELMARLDKAFYDNQGRVGNVRSQGGYTPSREIIEAKSRIESMPTSTSREKAAKKKAQKDWLLSSVDDAIKSHGDTRTINGKPFAESFADEFESLLRRRDATYDIKKSEKLDEQIAAAKKTIAQGEMLTFDVPDDGTFKIRNNPEALAVFKRMVQKRLSPTNLKEGTLAKAEKPLAEDVKEANIGEKQAEQPKESRRGPTVDAAKLEDPAFREWSQKRGTKADDAEALQRDRVAYDLDQATDAAKRTGNWLGVKVVRETSADAMPEGAKASIVTDDGILAQFDNPDGTVTLYRAVKVGPDGSIRPPQSSQIVGPDGKYVDRPAEGYIQPDGRITVNKDGTGGAPTHMAEERPDLAKTKMNASGTDIIRFTEQDVKDGKCTPDMVGQPKHYFDLKKGKVFDPKTGERMKDGGSTDDVLYDPYGHTSNTPFNDQFSSAWRRPDWMVIRVKVLKSDLESGYRAEKAGLAVGPHPWNGGSVDNQLPPELKRKVFLHRYWQLERLVSDSEAADILDKKWGHLKDTLEIPDNRVTPGMREEMRKRGFKIVKTGNVKYLKGANGQVVGWYDPATKEVHLKPGADAKTVAHEVGWHATYDWAKANHPALAKTMEQYAANAPEALKSEIRKLYGRDLTPAELIEEIGAGRFEREHGKKLQKLLADRANRTWYAKVWDGIKDAYKAVLTKLGFNRVDLDEALKDKTPEQAMDFLASAMARGKALGKMRPGKAREGARPMAAITPVPSPSGTGLFVDPQTKLRGKFIGFRIGGLAKLGFGWGEQGLREGKYQNIALRALDERLGRWTDDKPTNDSLFMHRINQEGLKKAAMDRSDFYENAIGKLMKEHGFGVPEVDAYLHYLGSPERNALVERRDGRTNGSGESDQHWADVWNAVVTKYGPEAQYIKQAAHIAWAMQDEGLASRLYSGRMAWDHYDTIKNNEPHHIPHKKDLSELDPELYSTSGGKGIRRNEFMAAHGTDGSDSPLVFMFREFRDAELGSRENEWRIRLADAVRQNPDLGRIRSAQRMENGLVKLDGDIGRGLKLEQKKEMHHPADGGDPNLVLFKEGGELKAIELNGDFGSDIADAVTGRSIADFENEGIKKVSRLYASTATSLSPTFGFGNFVKDKVEVGLHNVGDFGFGRLAYIPKGLAESATDMTGTSSMMHELGRYQKTRAFDTTTADGRLLKEFVEAGGQIGGAASEGFQDTLKRFDKFNLASKQGKLNALWETFQNFNERMEMINRLRNFKTARDHGMSPSQAAFKSRQDSTDFNAFGRQKWMNTVWNFSNSVTGGTLASMVRFTKGASSKRVIGTLAGLGVIEALMEYMLNGNDEKEELEGKSIGKDMSEYERANAIIIRKGERFFRVPIHAGPYSIIKYAFNGATRVALGLMDAKEYAKNLASEVRDTAKHFTGTGDVAGGDEEDLPILNALGAPDIGQSFAPSMLQPVVQIKEKKTFSGAPMESYMQPNDPEPKAWNGRADTEIGYKWMAQAQNWATGGDQHLKGWADNSPEVFKAAFEGVFKNTGKDAMQTFDVLKNLTTGHLPELRNVPVVNRFVRKVQPNDRRYYEALKQYKAIVNKATNEEDSDKATRWVRKHPSGDSSVDKRGARMATELDNLIKNVEFYKKQSQGYEPVLTGEMSPSGVPQVARWEPVELTREAKEAIDADLRRAQAEFIVTFRKYEADGK